MQGVTYDNCGTRSLYLDDMNYQRSNIIMNVIIGAGHFPWIEKMDEVVDAINLYKNNLK